MLVTKSYTFTAGAVIIASEHNSDFDVLYSLVNGNIENVNISSGAAITDSKLDQITSASKVSGAALTNLSSIPSGAGAIPAANITGTVPSGGIIMWSGTIATIPSGWVLCNGSNSTPDLRNLFVVGANADSGGVAKSTITGAALQSGGSTTITGTTDGASAGGAGAVTFNTNVTQHVHAFSTTSVQPFYALAYIMKS